VEDYWHEIGKSGYLIWRYRLAKILDVVPISDDSDAEQSPTEEHGEITPAPRREGRVLRVVRDTSQARQIKEVYEYRCQMCGTRLEGLAGPYAEAAHIRPLGRPHNGPDTRDNLICLCPNHHVLFDHGGVTIADDLSLVGEEGELTVHPRHSVSEDHLRYRRERYRADA
jgi:putative restriction endonuclease